MEGAQDSSIGQKWRCMPDNTNSRATSKGNTERKTPHPLRVLLVNQHYAPADAPTAKLLTDVGAALVAEGHDVTAIASRRGYHDASKVFPRRETIEGVDVRRLPGTAFTQKRRRGRVANSLAFFAVLVTRMLTIHKPDVVVCLSTPPMLGAIVQAFASIGRTRMVYWVMDVHPELAFKLGYIKPDSLIGKVLDKTARIPLGHADVVIALGDDMAAKLEPYSNGNMRVVRTWADGDRITPRETRDHPLRKEWGWEGKFVVAYSGNMGHVHEFDTILEAATRLDDDDRYLFCFMGGGPRTEAVKKEADKRNLTNIEFRDYVPEEELPLSLTAPDIHVVTLREDLAGLSIPSKTYSVLAAGKPVAFIGPGESDIARIVENNNCGVHVANGDASKFIAALHSYRESHEILASHAASARQTFDGAFTREQGVTSIARAITA